ncbi:hypothetical protein BH23BAC1_BH23BAC1_07630 [soil metagenome]
MSNFRHFYKYKLFFFVPGFLFKEEILLSNNFLFVKIFLRLTNPKISFTS